MRTLFAIVVACLAMSGCKSLTQFRSESDKTANSLVKEKQKEAVKHDEPFTIETPADTLRRRLLTDQKLANSGPTSFGTDQLTKPDKWPEADQPMRAESTGNPVPPWEAGKPVKISLVQALQIAARNSRRYQDRKEGVFVAALNLDEELDRFRNTYTGAIGGLLSADESTKTRGVSTSSSVGWDRMLESGATLSALLIFDTATLLASGHEGSVGTFFDASVTVPLLRGAGKHIIYESVTQAERELIYALWDFERFKRIVAVDVADEYLRVLQAQDGVINAQNNYDRRVSSTKQTEALAQAGRLSKVQVDQAKQALLSSRDSLIRSDQSYKRQLDAFKISLGLPTDASLVLDRDELNRLAAAARVALEEADKEKKDPEKEVKAKDLVEHLRSLPGGRYEIAEEKAVELALDKRLDLKSAHGRVVDAQRRVIIAADGLKAGLDLVAGGSFGERRSAATATSKDGRFRPDKGFYSLGLNADLPWERTAEANAYRESYIALEAVTRGVQALEDQIKLDIRNDLRALLEARESYKTQAQSLKLAEQRVDRDQMFLDAGRPGISVRDVLEAEDDLLAAQNALTSALVGYRVSELRVQRDMGVLDVNHKGLWKEYEAEQK